MKFPLTLDRDEDGRGSVEGVKLHFMTLTIELPSEVEKLLREVARERGVELEDVIAQRLHFSNEELEELEDELDVAEAKRRLANDDPGERKTLDDLRRAWNL